jgi:hypothetical protein
MIKNIDYFSCPQPKFHEKISNQCLMAQAFQEKPSTKILPKPKPTEEKISNTFEYIPKHKTVLPTPNLESIGFTDVSLVYCPEPKSYGSSQYVPLARVRSGSKS